MTRPRKRAVFLDKDGTLVENVPYNVDPSLIQMVHGAAKGLRSLRDAGYLLVVISNQSGIAHGLFEEPALVGVERRLRNLCEMSGVQLSGFYYCPHHPEGIVAKYTVDCLCRKPAPGLLIQAARELGIEMESSWFVGDILDDVEAGRRAHCQTVLIDNGNETEWHLSPNRVPDYMVPDIAEATRIIIGAGHR